MYDWYKKQKVLQGDQNMLRYKFCLYDWYKKQKVLQGDQNMLYGIVMTGLRNNKVYTNWIQTFFKVKASRYS